MGSVLNSEEVFNNVSNSKFYKNSTKIPKNNKSKSKSKHRNITGDEKTLKRSSLKKKNTINTLSNEENNNSNEEYKILLNIVESNDDIENISNTRCRDIENEKSLMNNKSYEEKETKIKRNNMNTVFVLISCPHSIMLEKNYINLNINVTRSEFRVITEKNFNLYYEQDNNEQDNIKNNAFNSLGNKNIYLYCANLEFNKEK
ncbi:hypothetical protein LY90DRAFT_514039 [Neocallimastix californiae]|uniref:Uncharacterized protein n=1 Tax=Neocallimastix californiae TaxID=1754190 RepID=A0A1Y2ATA9_9FUNG|nr:hypothetical protein LY90DRAFT_514039 [Neocallimastix californiae]|eukprot:ORY25782.1 hypothetical protein LY90DRAFT_514039 [Neocallimastix californiae]